jgi:hypothetical protein
MSNLNFDPAGIASDPEVKRARSAYRLAVSRAERLADMPGSPDINHDELEQALEVAHEARDRLDNAEAVARSRSRFQKQPLDDTKVVPLAGGGIARISVDEPDM